MKDSEIIERLGGPAEVARRLDVRVQVISNWRNRGISAAGRYQIKELARQDGIILPESFLAQKRKLGGKRTHGRSDTPEYKSWEKMKNRCLNKNSDRYPHYGGRGIKICARWLNSFENFLADMGPRPSLKHTLDRLDNNGDYKPSNCRWATKAQQQWNKRNTRFVTVNGRRVKLAEACAVLGVPVRAVRGRLRQGWSWERAIKF